MVLVKLLGQLAGSICVGLLSYFLWRLYNARLVFWRLKKLGMPMPPWNPVLGHLLVLPAIIKHLPKDVQQSWIFRCTARDFEASDGLHYIDLWPFAMPMILVTDPLIANEVCVEHDFGKPEMLKPFFSTIVGGDGMFTMNGAEWKKSHALFAPGFAERVILERMGQVVGECEVYVERLRNEANKGEIFSLDELTCDYMMDVIGTITLSDPLASAMRDQINIHVRDEHMNPIKRYSPFQLYKEHRNSHIMDSYITSELHKRYTDYLSSATNSKSLADKSIIDLVIADHMRDRPASATLDTDFIKWACAQIRLFLFVGHDSTASTIVYSLYLLSKNPSALARLRDEHTKVFGPDVSTAPSALRANPRLINQLPFTTAVIKETLRLFPPAGGFRGGEPGTYITDSHGKRYPTEGTGLNVLHNCIHRNPRYWPQPDAFVPERWLVGPEHELYPRTKGAWRPFEYGTRNCPGQTLVMLDAKVTLVLVAREFDVRDAYGEWDAENRREGGVKDVDGERAYQVGKGSAHPSDGFPCRIEQRVGS
ncbi:hypothetical protein DPSP01_006044 [Paraphaeosphaeria sporulosa]